jgi:hypothetical protein
MKRVPKEQDAKLRHPLWRRVVHATDPLPNAARRHCLARGVESGEASSGVQLTRLSWRMMEYILYTPFPDVLRPRRRGRGDRAMPSNKHRTEFSIASHGSEQRRPSLADILRGFSVTTAGFLYDVLHRVLKLIGEVLAFMHDHRWRKIIPVALQKALFCEHFVTSTNNEFLSQRDQPQRRVLPSRCLHRASAQRRQARGFAGFAINQV